MTLKDALETHALIQSLSVLGFTLTVDTRFGGHEMILPGDEPETRVIVKTLDAALRAALTHIADHQARFPRDPARR